MTASLAKVDIEGLWRLYATADEGFRMFVDAVVERTVDERNEMAERS